jgi:hypothetical protein
METWFIVGRFLLFGSLLIFPQLLGILLYYRLHRAPRWIAAIAAALLPAIIFFWLAPIFFFAGIREAYARGEGRGCGMPAVAATFFVLAGTVGQLLVGVLAQLVLSARRHLKPTSFGT